MESTMNPNIPHDAVTAGRSLTMIAAGRVKTIFAAFGQTLKRRAQTASILKTFPFPAAGCSRPRRTNSRFVRWQKGSLVICLGLTWLSLGQVSQAANEQAAQAVDRASALYISKSIVATVEMQIVRKDWQRTISMQFWSLGESKILLRILQPQEDAGTAFLKIGNKAWNYLPKANRTVEMPGSMMMSSWMGSHFTLSDLMHEGSLTKDYEVTTSFEGPRDGVAVSEYTLTPKAAAAVVWGKIMLEIRQADLMPVWQRYYDEDGKLVRELSFSGYKTVGGRLIPTRLVMRPQDPPGEQTTITYDNIVFDGPVSEDIFSLNNLKQ
jgi:outer membrane lipoprotein-sorting protein